MRLTPHGASETLQVALNRRTPPLKARPRQVRRQLTVQPPRAPLRANPFHRQGLNRSRLARLAWSGSPDGWPEDRPGPAEASVRLEVPGGYGHAAAHMRVEADVVVRRSAAIDIARQQQAENAPHALPACWSVPPQQLGGLIDAMLATLTGKEVTAALAGLAGTDILAIPQPRIMHIVTERPIPDVLGRAVCLAARWRGSARSVPRSGVLRLTSAAGSPGRDAR